MNDLTLPEKNSKENLKSFANISEAVPAHKKADTLYRLEEVSKIYQGPAEELVILRNINMVLEQGESAAVVGASGAGKSTLLHMLGTLDAPTEGKIFFNGRDIGALRQEEKAALRNSELGFIFQFHHLLPEFTARENVAMQAIIGGMPKKRALAMADEALAMVGLAERREHAVGTMSGGERQRAAIARAMLKNPKVLLADEPTGNLDEATGAKVAELLLDLNAKFNTTLIVVTHNPELAALMGRRLELRAGDIYDRRN